MKVKISKNLTFSYKERPKIIAEISGNHNGSKKKFLKLIKESIISGADLIKIQTYEPVDITINSKSSKFKIKEGIWKGKYLWDLYQKAHTPFKWHKDAFKLANKYKKILFSSPFSCRAVDLLEKNKVKLYKIASFEINDHHLIDYIASKKKPIIFSTGVASLEEIKKAIKIINKYHNKIIIFHCVSDYPTALKNTNLNRINLLKKTFKKQLIGLSDHTNEIYSSVASIPLGVVAIEKHFNIKSRTKTVDSDFSINSKQLKDLKDRINDIFLSTKLKKKITINNQSEILKRSLFASKDLKKGAKITKNDITTLRPKIGISAEYFYKVIGKKIKRKILKDEPIYKRDLL